MVSCAACGCSNTIVNKSLKVTFHCFPKGTIRRNEWIKFVNKPEWIPKSTSALCSHHFVEKDFDRSSQLIVRLRPTAVPTVEVDRLKYVRNFNPIRKRPVEDDLQNEVGESGKIIKVEPNLMSEPGPATLVHSPLPSSLDVGPVCLNALPQDTYQTTVLKRKIAELQKKDILKRKKIHALQKIVWRQRRRILYLKSMTVQQEHLMLEHQTEDASYNTSWRSWKVDQKEDQYCVSVFSNKYIKAQVIICKYDMVEVVFWMVYNNIMKVCFFILLCIFMWLNEQMRRVFQKLKMYQWAENKKLRKQTCS